MSMQGNGQPSPGERVIPTAGESDELAWRLAFLQLGPEEAASLRKLREINKRFLREFVDGFYEHLFSFSETAQFLRDPELVARLKEAQQNHLDSMLEADWTSTYVERRHRVGHVHAEVGLPPQFFLGAYNQYVQHCFRTFAALEGPEAQKFAAAMLPLMKVIFLDIGLTLDAYFLQATRQLREALDLYWKVNDDLRRFAQLASHDLRTPLATVANLCDEVLDEFGDQLPPAAKDLIRQARDRTFQNGRMIDELLASTLSLREESSGEAVDIGELFRDVAERLGLAAKAKGIEVRVPTSAPSVWANRVRVREALCNLIGNAIKFMDKPRGQIELTAEKQSTSVLITVADTGPGIPAEELEHIFLPFRRLPAHRHLPGSGLGLYFTKQLIEGDGGRIWVESIPGSGTRFFVLLPTTPHGSRAG